MMPEPLHLVFQVDLVRVVALICDPLGDSRAYIINMKITDLNRPHWTFAMAHETWSPVVKETDRY